jgi:hypothetical protein
LIRNDFVKNPLVRLLINLWTPGEERRREIDACLRKNLENPFLDRIVIVDHSAPEHSRSLDHAKIDWVNLDCRARPCGRPTYEDWFRLANEHCQSPYDLSIVANADIYFDETLGLVKAWDLSDTCLALSRHEVHADGTAHLECWHNSQDAWIFQGFIRPVRDIDYPLGIYYCDCRLARELRHADYYVANPCHTLKAYHLHLSGVRNSRRPLDGPISDVQQRTAEEANLRPWRLRRDGVIAFSLFGSQPKYLVGAVQNALLAKHLYPGWVARFYVDGSVPRATIDQLAGLHADLVFMPPSERLSGTFWRFAAADDRRFAYWLVRDADSRLNIRDRAAVDAWIASGKPFHVMRDHPDHANPIMACSFGGVGGYPGGMAAAADSWPRKSSYCDDEAFLAAVIWPRVKDDAMVHDGCYAAPRFGEAEVLPFPRPLEFGRFVGERCHEDEHWRHEDRDKLWLAKAKGR